MLEVAVPNVDITQIHAVNSQIEKVIPHQGTRISNTLFNNQASRGLGRGTMIVIINLNRLYETDIYIFKKTVTCVLPADVRNQDP